MVKKCIINIKINFNLIFKSMKTETMEISPSLATTWLEKNTRNRPLNQRVIDSLSHQIKTGKWQLNGESIIISETGKVLDGQHRLHSIVNSQTSIKSVVVLGAKDDSFLTIDTGKSRSGSNVLALEGHDYYSPKAALISLLIYYKRGIFFNYAIGKINQVKKKRLPITNMELLNFANNHKREIQEAIDFAVSDLSKKCKFMAVSNLAFFYYILDKKDAQDSRQFLEKLVSGENLSSNSPIYILRETLLREYRSSKKSLIISRMVYVVKAWNAFRSNTSMRLLSFKGSAIEEIPVIL